VNPKTVPSIPLFASVPRRRRWHVASLADEVEVSAGTELTRQGGYAQEFFVVVSGAADVYRDGELVGVLAPGDFFG
jgi:CRP-like cAMP-binding protein